MEDLLSYVLPWAEQNKMPVEDVTFRCFLYIERNAGLLSRYHMAIAELGAKPKDRQQVNMHIALQIEQRLNLTKTGQEVQLPKGQFLINYYSVLQEKC